MRREIFIDETSMFMSTPMILFMGICCIAAMYRSMDEISLALLFLIGIAAIAQGYSRLTLRAVTVDIVPEKNLVFPGERVRIFCKLQNTGRLPVIHSLIRIPLIKYGSFAPINKADYRDLTEAEISKGRMYGEAIGSVLEKRMTFFRGNESVEWPVELKAVKRGETAFEAVFVYCGEPFGLTHTAKTVKTDCRLPVCAKIVPVRVEPFLRNLRFSNKGVKSIHDDITLIKSNRGYETFDEARSINWRMLAGQNKLTVNLYDQARAKQVHIIFDGESYNSKYIKEAAFENTLQIIFSVVLRLYQRGMGCGISLPQSENSDAANLVYRNAKTLPLIAAYLAKYQYTVLEEKKQDRTSILQERSSLSSAIIKAREEKQKGIPRSRSIFRVSDLLQKGGDVGEYFYFTYDAEKMKDNHIFTILSGEKLTVVSYKKCRVEKRRKRYRTIDISAIGEERKP